MSVATPPAAESGQSPRRNSRVVVIGAGPAGLAAAHALVYAGHEAVVLERDPEYVGGIARTVRYKQWRFDLGGHRFFSKNDEVVRWWHARLGGDFIRVSRASSVLYRGRFFAYPLRAGNALRGLGLFESAACIASYLAARVRPIRPERSFTDWVTNRFGRRLFRIFFQTYTEKVWGIPCREISADWAAQRIKGFSLGVALASALGLQRRDELVKTLIDSFEYPRLGPGMMWERVRAEIESAGGRVELGATAREFALSAGRITHVRYTDSGGAMRELSCDEVIVSMPLSETVAALGAHVSAEVRAAAAQLRYRDFLTVAVVLQRERLFAENWLYVHDPAVRVGRIQNFNNWSPQMNEAAGTTCLGLEYFCSQGDDLWNMADAKLIALARRELEQLGIGRGAAFVDAAVVRVEKAYPVYDGTYASAVETIRGGLSAISNLQPVGRNGMHKYNNQDHSIMTGFIAAARLDGDTRDPWRVNTDAEYHEEDATGRDQSGRAQPHVPAGEASAAGRE